jgi:hypothetical protein
MPVVIANKADRTAADGIGLAVEDVNARTLLHDDNFMKIMVMFRKGRLREAGSIATVEIPALKKSVLCNMVMMPPS